MKKNCLNSGIKFIMIFMFLFNTQGFPTAIIFQKSIYLSQEKAMIMIPGSFFITKIGYIYLIDRRDANIKIFNRQGRLIRVFGRRGLGPNEFTKPMFSAYKDNLVAIEDMGRQVYFIYRIDKDKGLKILKKCLNNNLSSDFHFIDSESLLIGGEKIGKDGKWQLPYIYNFMKEKYEYIIPIEVAYGYNSYNEYRTASMGSQSYIQNDFRCDLNDKFFYLINMSDLRIIRIDRKNQEVFVFGEKTENYFKPFENREIRKAYRERNRKVIIKYMNKMSNIMDVFILNSGKIGLIFVGPEKSSPDLHVFFQLYSNNGKLIKELKILDSKVSELYDLKYYFEKSKNLIYILEPKILEDLDQKFFVHVVKIEE